MGKQSKRANRRDRKQRVQRAAAVGACLAILNVGTGDTKISFDKENLKERERACRIVTDMLRRGYAILVAAGEKDGKPIYYRATDFDPETAEYIVAGTPEDEAGTAEVPAPRRRGRQAKHRVPAERTPAVAVARSAGGMSDRVGSIEARNADNFAALRYGLTRLAAERDQWAGVPMPLDDHPLVVEPQYPRAAALMAFGRAAAEGHQEQTANTGKRIRNRFYSVQRRCDIIIWEENGRIEWGLHHAIHSFNQQVETLGASVAWGLAQETAALETLSGLISPHAYKMYLLTGSFLETSKRSGLTYMFRKLRPTVAIGNDDGQLKIRAALCMHPIAYYQGTWSGAMCPTDDVIAHLMMMRGDEPLYWRRCNQHPAYRPEAGL